MKRVVVVCVLCAMFVVTVAMLIGAIMVGTASAVDWYPANKSTLAWTHDNVVSMPDGTTVTIPPEQLSYRVFRILATETDKAGAEFVATTQDKTHVMAFSQEGRYHLGVQAVRTIPGEEDPIVSPVAWSDNPENTHDKPFGVTFWVPPATPTEVRAE